RGRAKPSSQASSTPANAVRRRSSSVLMVFPLLYGSFYDLLFPAARRIKRVARLAGGAAGAGAPAGLQNRPGRAAHGWVGSTPTPLRFARIPACTNGCAPPLTD